MNNKFERTISARGLTVSNRGATIEYEGERFLVEDVKYQGNTTLVKITNYVVIPNDAQISIWD